MIGILLLHSLHLYLLFLFFSSRRRHTRFDCDWSSDVCSSDLGTGTSPSSPARSAPTSTCATTPSGSRHCGPHTSCSNPRAGSSRSEERRVGKECRNRWWKNEYLISDG